MMKRIAAALAALLMLFMGMTIQTAQAQTSKARQTTAPATPTEQGRPTQNIRGRVIDAASHEPIAYAAVVVDDMPQKGAVSDAEGNYVIEDVPVGRHTLRGAMTGYEPTVMKELMVTSGKECRAYVLMRESVTKLDEVVARPQVNKEKSLNSMALTGARMFSVEETSRYAGGFSDPARLASSFAGVSAQGSTNGISIHGNAPYLLAWRIEGVEVPNPNHFAEISGAGGGIMSALSAQLLGNSDFFTGAFPAEYGNAVSGVFDVNLRNGSTSGYEHTFQFGTLGIDFASEGPFGKGSKGSYVINYRYSAMGLAQKMGFLDMGGQSLNYQDLNFKVNLPTRRAGTLVLWGTGYYDKYKSEVVDSTEWKTYQDAGVSTANQKMIVCGLTHSIFLGSGGRLKTSAAVNHNYESVGSEARDTTLRRESLHQTFDGGKHQTNLVFDVVYNHKVSARYTHKAGATYTHNFFKAALDAWENDAHSMVTFYEADRDHGFLQAFTSNQWNVSDALTINAGLNFSLLTLNNNFSIEPRVGVRYQPSARTTLAAGYGLHSRKDKNEFYYVVMDGRYVNEDLQLLKAHHVMLSYSYKLTDNTIVKIEPFYQRLTDVAVERGKEFSVINFQDFTLHRELHNDGAAYNWGMDATLERYLADGWYGLLTASVFDSRYRGGDGRWRNTRYNRHCVVNILGGKEWMVGRGGKNVFSLNGKLTCQGGERSTPVDMEATARDLHGYVQYIEEEVYSRKRKPQLSYSFSIGYKINAPKVSHHFFCDMISARGVHGDTYNIADKSIGDMVVKITLPNIGYKIEF